ncbi:MAG: hypothetical protein C0600_05655 [Ignavibacteria bacterium]|nr:MAG: hypothetical protein C0600_05655 [Ignavibacteria bacterium]
MEKFVTDCPLLAITTAPLNDISASRLSCCAWQVGEHSTTRMAKMHLFMDYPVMECPSICGQYPKNKVLTADNQESVLRVGQVRLL